MTAVKQGFQGRFAQGSYALVIWFGSFLACVAIGSQYNIAVYFKHYEREFSISPEESVWVATVQNVYVIHTKNHGNRLKTRFWVEFGSKNRSTVGRSDWEIVQSFLLLLLSNANIFKSRLHFKANI